MAWDQYIYRLQRENPERNISPEYRRLPIAYLGGVVYFSSLFWQAWTAREGIHWIVPMMAGVPFGFGFCIIFTAFLNYLADAYEIYAASAMAATSMCRSMLGAAFPLFAPKSILPLSPLVVGALETDVRLIVVYKELTIPWASSLLGFAAVVMTIIPYLFIRNGKLVNIPHSAFAHNCSQGKKSGPVRSSVNSFWKGKGSRQKRTRLGNQHQILK